MVDAPDEAGVGKYFTPVESEPDYDYDDTLGVTDPGLISQMSHSMHMAESAADSWMHSDFTPLTSTAYFPQESQGSGYFNYSQSLGGGGDVGLGVDGITHV